mmetsp:Transcript_11577/g.48560  ORF Transcript_11577/g.48560 Transcript_11577/m.48560 type:complete len:238 (+) Transcript_11577:817-1530(+)
MRGRLRLPRLRGFRRSQHQPLELGALASLRGLLLPGAHHERGVLGDAHRRRGRAPVAAHERLKRDAARAFVIAFASAFATRQRTRRSNVKRLRDRVVRPERGSPRRVDETRRGGTQEGGHLALEPSLVLSRRDGEMYFLSSPRRRRRLRVVVGRKTFVVRSRRVGFVRFGFGFRRGSGAVVNAFRRRVRRGVVVVRLVRAAARRVGVRRVGIESQRRVAADIRPDVLVHRVVCLGVA